MRIRVIDVETTGLEPTDAIVEVGAWDVVDGIIGPIAWRDTLVNPACPIPPQVSAVHHIVDEDVARAAPFADVVDDIVFRADAFCAHNAQFERQWFTDEVCGGRPWICTYRCALRVWPDAPAHNNQALRYWLKPEGLDRELARVAHRAAPDAYVTAFTLRELLSKASFEDLVKWTGEPALLPKVGFGKHFGARWADVPRDYLQWIVGKQDMGEDVLHTARHHLQARR